MHEKGNKIRQIFAKELQKLTKLHALTLDTA